MNRPYLPYAISAILAMIMASCNSADVALVDDGTIDADFHSRVSALGRPEYFEVFADSASMSADELTAMKWLYAYMPLPDLVDYPGSYFSANVQAALRARQEMPWGKTVPQREFLHFVLPIRVNNENLDDHRTVLYDELKRRVEGMTMEQAILEINHWCHEHVTYEPSDARTHSPLATMSSAIGRCGEESTFTVAALRTIGIPARQVYTPRWAHTDDNHAWVEAWADGRWHFLGACEPEAVLDLGWFNEPASRGMLMNTRTPGRYGGPEEKLEQTPMYTDINVTEIYADVDTVKVAVIDADGRPVNGATVDFCIYNYAELYPVATKVTAADGRASLVAGLGDLFVWASKDGAYSVRKASVGKDRQVTLTLTPGSKGDIASAYDIVPPQARRAKVDVPQQLADENARRKAYEDSLRMAYVGGFVDQSRGNAAVIKQFVDGLDPTQTEIGRKLLASLTVKDLTDVTLDVLNDAMAVTPIDDDFYVRYVMSPRIENEFLVPFRQRFASAFTPSQREAFKSDPSTWAQWVADSIRTGQQWQPARVRMSPWSVWRLRDTDVASRNVFFVAGARAMGIPARIEEISGRPQYYAQGAWHDIPGMAADSGITQKGRLVLQLDSETTVDNPQYYVHFTLSKIEGGRPQLLNYPEDADWRNTFSRPQLVEAGDYLLVTGQRLADGSVLATAKQFTVTADGMARVPLTIRHDTEALQVIGALNSEDLYYDVAEDTQKSILSTTGRGYYILGIVSALDEPSNHALRDIAAKKSELQQSQVPVLILFPSKADMDKCPLVDDLRSFATIGIDTDASILSELTANMQLGTDLPILVVADTFNRVVYLSQGYTIGLGQSLTDAISKLQR